MLPAGCPTIDEEPLSADEWITLARWMAHHEWTRTDDHIRDRVRLATWRADEYARLLMACDPTLTSAQARAIVRPLLHAPPDPGSRR
jgi:hypothetical protein